MSLEGKQRVVGHHPTSVVGNLDELLATRLHLNADARGLGIQSIFQKFFHHRCGPLHHLAGGDLVGNGFGKNVDLAHEVLGWPVVSLSDDNWEGKESSGKLSDELWAKFLVAPSSDRLDLPQVPARSRAVRGRSPYGNTVTPSWQPIRDGRNITCCPPPTG